METAMKENGQMIWRMDSEISILIPSASDTKESSLMVSETGKGLMCSKTEICK